MPKVQGGNMVRALQDTASGRAIFTPSYNRTKDKEPHLPESPPGREDRHWPRTVTPGAERTEDGQVGLCCGLHAHLPEFSVGNLIPKFRCRCVWR